MSTEREGEMRKVLQKEEQNREILGHIYFSSVLSLAITLGEIQLHRRLTLLF